MDCQTVALRVLAHFVPGPKVLDFLAAEADWLDIRWCADDDSAESQAAFYRELPEADVILACAAPTFRRRPVACDPAAAGAQVRRRGQHHRRRRGHRARHRRRQHARRQRAVGGRGNGAADAGRAAPAADAGPRHPRRPRLAVRPAAGRDRPRYRRLHRRDWSATATSPSRSRASSPRWAPRCCTPARATTGCPAGGRCRHCWPTATSCRCTCR